MRIPKRFADLTSSSLEPRSGPCPPAGFCALAEHELGNGDAFGLYWPFPMFSSLDAFLQAADGLDPDEYLDEDALESDAASPLALLNAAKAANAARKAEEAESLLRRAVQILPEYTDAHVLLAAVCQRLGKNEDAMHAVVQAIITPPCFGAKPVRLLRWLQSRPDGVNGLERDPLWRERKRLTLTYGGSKENDDYPIMRDAIDAYLADRQFLKAVTLMQTYAELMYRETTAFQQRYGFDQNAFLKRQREVFAAELSTTREPAR
jgi:tetratricopeptide (TPR) repeat protein